ncbi:MAG: ComF family protein [Anaerovoracaceae bacterium]
MKIIEKVLELVFPSNIYCICCGSAIDKTRDYALCDQCVKKFYWIDNKTCSKCGKILEEEYWRDCCEDCITNDHIFDKGFTCARYGLYERVVMMEYKYSDKSYIGNKLGDILYDRIVIEELDFNVIISIPIHKKRMEKRGFNQAEIMAKRLSYRLGKDVFRDFMIRVIDTVPMKNLGIAERRENVKNSFVLKKEAIKEISGKNVLLIDDIYTTGSTFDSAAEVLKKNGANKVYILTFAAGGNVIK